MLPDNIREFGDAATARKWIYENSLESVANRFPVEDENYRLELNKPHYDGPQDFSLTKQKDALLKQRHLYTPIKGTWKLIHRPTGSTIDEREDTVLQVPYLTDRGTFIYGGSEYSGVSQSRLKPGAYTRITKSGIPESFFNVAIGSGKNFRIHMEPETGIFKINIGQASLPAYPIMQAMGIDNGMLERNWGKDVLDKNSKARSAGVIDKLYTRMAGPYATPAANAQDKIRFIREEFPKYKLDKWVIARNLGLQDVDGVTPEVLLRSTSKLLGIFKGDEQPDDRDAPVYSNVLSYEDLIKERIDKDAGRLSTSLFNKIKRDKNLKRMPFSALNPYVEGYLFGSRLTMPLEETNPMHTWEQKHRVVKTGEGGIGSAEAVTESARNVNLGQLGFIDAVAGPESGSIGIDTRVAYKTFKGRDKQMYAEFKDLKDGKLKLLRPEDIDNKVIAFPSQKMDDPKAEVVASKGNKIVTVPASEVDYQVPSFAHMQGSGANSTVMPTGIMPGRLFYISKYWSQFMPLVKGETPLVDTLMPDEPDTTFLEYYGKKAGSITAPIDGQVLKVTDDAIVVGNKDGQREIIELVKDFPFNRLSVTGDTAVFIKGVTGIVKIKIANYIKSMGNEVLSYDPITKKSCWQTIKEYIKHTNTKKLLRITFASGRHVDVTRDHSLLTLDSDWNLVPIYPEDCVINSTRCPIVFGNDCTRTEWTYNEGILDGLYLSEGCILKQKGLCSISVTPTDRKDYVKQLIIKLGGTPHKGNKDAVTWTDHKLWNRWFNDFGKYAYGKFIAPHVFSRGRPYLNGLIAGYMSGDGCLHQDTYGSIQLEASTISKQLRDDLISVLNLLGIFAIQYPPKFNGDNRYLLHKLRIRSSDIPKLAVWFGYPDRQAKLMMLVSKTYRASDYDHIPFQRKSRKLVYSACPGRPTHFVYKSANCGKVAKQRLVNYTGIVGDWAKSDILWDTIVDISPIAHQEYVYDFSVASSEAFALANGLMVHNTSITYKPSVKVGDGVKKGALLAHSNFTDPKTGSLSMGVNLKSAIIPMRGWGYEDSHVLSESAAKKLATQRLYGYDATAKHGIEIDKNKYMGLFADKFTREQVDKLDGTGVVKPGTVLQKGDPIILAIGPKLLSPEDVKLGKLHKVLRSTVTNKAQVWENDYPGYVTDSLMTGKTAIVNVSAQVPLRIGDKIVTMNSLKGTVGRIIPDDEMPRDQVTNQPYEILLNPMGILSRVAPNQIAEMQLAKVAKMQGKQLRIPQDAPEEGWNRYVLKQLEDAKISPTADIYDPVKQKTVKGITDGYLYMSAFHHLAEKKLSERGGGAGGYTADQQPSHGGYEGGGAKKFGCFVGAQCIRTINGEEEIGHLVEKRIPALVWAPDNNGDMGYHRITSWFVRQGNPSEVINIRVAHLPCQATNKPYSVSGTKNLRVTRNHVLYRPDLSQVTAGEVKTGEWLATYGYQLTKAQRSILIGSMLGDGSILNNTKQYATYQEMHSSKQSNYSEWKQTVLRLVISNRSSTGYKSKTGFGAKYNDDGTKTRVHYYGISRPDIVNWLRTLFITNNRKSITQAVIDSIDDLAICVWLLDDGSITNHSKNGISLQGNIATHSFSYAENLLLVDMLNKRFKSNCKVHKTHNKATNKDHWFIYLDKISANKLVELIAKHIPANAIPDSKRWVKNYTKNYQLTKPVVVDGNSNLGIIPAQIIDIYPYKPEKDVATIPLYDIEVATVHRYCASDVVVSNSLDTNAALAHGASEVIRDVINIRGTKNEDFWKALKLGRPLPEPTVPFIYNKFLNLLRAGGINIREKGDILSLMPMTDDDVDGFADGEINNSGMVDKDFEPINNGLFDLGRTGGLAGNKWAKIKLNEPMPNPIFEEPIRRLLGLRQSDLYDIIAGKQQLNGMTGGQAIKDSLASIDIDEEINKHKELVQTLRGSNRDNSIKIIGYLSAIKKQGLHPSAWVISKVPVIPPIFRPISKLGDVTLQSDINELYRDVIETNDHIKKLHGDVGYEGTADDRINLYDAVKATYGLGESITPEGRSKRLKGAIRQVIGTSPKTGLFQSKVVSKPVDVVGRGVITPDPNIDMDSIGIPEDSAWTIYAPFIMRRMVQRGYPADKVMQLIKDRSHDARLAMVEEMRARPVIVDRAPVWHKFNLMAFYPHIVKDKVIRVSPLVTKSFGADFDGDEQINACYINLLDIEVKDYYITLKGYNQDWFNQRRVNMSYATRMGLPYVEGGNYYIVNLEDFPFNQAALIGSKDHIDFYEAEKFIKVIAYDEKTNNLKLAHVSGWSVHKDREVWLINLSRGFQIVSDDDERAVYGIKPNTLELTRSRPTDSIGMLVPIAKAMDMDTLVVDKSIDVLPGFGKLKDIIPLTKQVGYVLGALAGDGWYDEVKNRFNRVYLAGIEKEVTDQYKLWVADLFKEPPHVGHIISTESYGRSERWVISSVDFAKWVAPLIGKGAKNKHLPPCWFSASKEFKLGLLSGLLDTDGSISIGIGKSKPQLQFNFSSISIRLVQEVKHLLMTLGVRSRISFSKKTSVGNDFWILTPSNVDMYKLKSELCIAHTGNIKAFNTCVPDETSPAYVKQDIVPFNKAITNEVLNKILHTDKTLYTTISVAKQKGYITRQSAKEIIAICPEVNKEWQAIVNSGDVTWALVETVENTGIKETGYDLTVPGYETFMSADGIILSNTMNFHVPVSDKAVKQAADKMLPSRNLISLTDLRTVRYTPTQELALGLYTLSKDATNKKPRIFNTTEEAKRAYRKGEIKVNDPIEILGE